jgi:hypothetical protein
VACVFWMAQVWGHAWDNIDARVADVLENLNNPDSEPYYPRVPLVQDLKITLHVLFCRPDYLGGGEYISGELSCGCWVSAA